MMETVEHVYVGELNVTGFDPTAVPDKFNSYDVAVVISYFLLVLATGFYVSILIFFSSKTNYFIHHAHCRFFFLSFNFVANRSVLKTVLQIIDNQRLECKLLGSYEFTGGFLIGLSYEHLYIFLGIN